jgi:hypothetical protein
MRYEDGALQTQRASSQPVGVCLLYMSPGLSGQGCRSIATMRLRPTDVTGSGGNNHQTVTALVVPNAIASVTAHYSAEDQIGTVAEPSVTKRPDHNVVIFRLVGGWDPPTLTFKSANGKVLQTHLSSSKTTAKALSSVSVPIDHRTFSPTIKAVGIGRPLASAAEGPPNGAGARRRQSCRRTAAPPRQPTRSGRDRSALPRSPFGP